MNNLLILSFMVLIVAATGILMAAMPWLEAHGQCFSVTVPGAAASDERLVALKRRYAVTTLALTALCSIVVGVVFAADATGTAGIAVLVAASLVLVIVPFILMQVARGRVQAIKATEGWRAEHRLHVAALGEADLPQAVPLAWELLHLPLFLLVLVLGFVLMPSMPDRIAIHFDLAGTPNGWIEKGPAVIALPFLIMAFLAITMAACHLAVLRSKRGIASDAPATSAYGYALFVRAQSMMLVVLGLALNLVLALMPLTFAGIVSPNASFAAAMVVAASAVVACVWLAYAYGQNGSRAVKLLSERETSATGSESLNFDDDHFWHLGVFYANADDPAVVVPKRFGIGWGLNWARPASWLVTLGLIALCAALCLAVFLLL